MALIAGGTVMKAMLRIVPPHRGTEQGEAGVDPGQEKCPGEARGRRAPRRRSGSKSRA
jgi:hypothetical protein